MESLARGGTRWKRFAVVMVPSVAATAAIGVALSQGALAASFSVSGQQFKVTTDRLEGTGFVQYGAIDAQKGGKQVPVAVSGFSSAKIKNLCQSVVVPVPVFGDVSMKLSAGGGDTPVEAKNLYIDLDQLDADATFNNINIGVAAGSTSKGPGMHKGDKADPGSFAQEADSAVLTHVKQTAWATTAGTFKLSGLKMSVAKGKSECY
ncbi:DUF6230 family protein [Streptomyces inhibens]|uniref:DUF6230 family protein n=1 Tax=Streptomyces inhibens TaxID=2293571 RepID=UPI001EE7393C|nr:DUF6230 family protein [Streptomyces inhibens]UKY52745.1 DUF6230 family protein [Streptomyces inhibens]